MAMLDMCVDFPYFPKLQLQDDGPFKREGNNRSAISCKGVCTKEGTEVRFRSTIRRRQYNVMFPLELWHISTSS